jgi:predicted TPR repeat methyltransferase
VPQDPFQIAQEHHRAGRLRQAEAGYRTLISSDSNHADALHWLGVLLYQARQFEKAIPLLERAAAQRPRDSAVQHNLGHAYAGADRVDDAIAAFDRVLRREPSRVETLVALAHARLTRRRDDDAKIAIKCLRRAQEAGSNSADIHYDLGVAFLADRQEDEAIASFKAALEKNPNHAWAYHHMAMAHRLKGESKEVRKSLIKALEIDPGISAAWYALGMLDTEAGNPAQARASFLKATAAKAADHSSKPTSVAELEQRITPDETMQRLHDVLADAANLAIPAPAAPQQVAKLFDQYADGFDEHLVEKLGYRVPQLIAEAIRNATPLMQSLDIFDLGCGTGLCGELLRWKASKLHGVDLSPAMIERARGRGVYDHLEVDDLVESLRRHPKDFDLLIAADVMNYLGDLAPVMEAAASALRPGGLFAFSVEATEAERFLQNRKTHRYAHSKSYLQHVGRIFGFEIRSIDPIIIRVEAGEPVQGFLVLLAQPTD